MAQVPYSKGFVENPESLGESLKNYRLIHGKTQREMAQDVGCHLVSYQMWEAGKTEPQPSRYPSIISILGESVRCGGGSVGEFLRFERLSKGLNLAEMAHHVGIEVEIWSRLENGMFPPSRIEIELLKQYSITLPPGTLERSEGGPTPLSLALRCARIDRKLSQAEIAKQLGYGSGSSWSRLETSGRVPVRSKWERIKEVLGVDVGQLIS